MLDFFAITLSLVDFLIHDYSGSYLSSLRAGSKLVVVNVFIDWDNPVGENTGELKPFLVVGVVWVGHKRVILLPIITLDWFPMEPFDRTP